MSRDAMLIVGGGPLQEAVVQAVQARGLAALVTDRDPTCHCAALADELITLDTADVQGHGQVPARLEGRWDLRGVCTAGADVAPSVAAAAEAANLPGIPLPIAALSHHKFDVRGALTAADLDRYQPEYWRLDLQPRGRRARSPAHRVQAVADTIGYPLVLKPFEACASRGVSIIHRPEAIDAALAKARMYGASAILEQGLRGTEHSAEMIFAADGRPIFFNVVDRLFRYDDGIPLELGHVNPSRLPLETRLQLHTLLLETAQAIGVRWGPWKVDVMLTAAGPKILECTARLSGGWDSQCTTPLSSQRRPIDVVVDLARGETPRLEDLTGAATHTAACLAAFPSPGRVRSIRCLDAADVPRMTLVRRSVQVGDVIEPSTHCATRPAFVICVDADTALALAQTAAAWLAAAIETEPV